MGGMYTQSRVVSHPQPGTGKTNTGSSFTRGGLASNGIPTQTTTSFRGNVAADSGLDPAYARLASIRNDGRWATYSKYDTGHSFDTNKEEVTLSHPFVTVKPFVYGSQASYVGPLISPNVSPITHAFASAPSVNLDYWGTKAISDTRPNRPVFDAANTLGELRVDGLPSIPGTLFNLESKTLLARSIGKEYLNLSFGWAPLVASLQDLLYVVINSEKLVYQYLRDNGKQIRRKRVYPDYNQSLQFSDNHVLTNSCTMAGTDVSDLFDPSKGGRGGRASIQTLHDRKIKFSGAYLYYLGDPNGELMEQMGIYTSLAKKLVGIRITPSTLWELKPWSWLADWFANIGPILGNVEGFSSDDLILKYGYLMVEDILWRNIVVYRHGMPAFGPFRTTFKTTRKRRFRAYPYGFSLNPVNFTEYQWGIIGALLSTKTPTSLR